MLWKLGRGRVDVFFMVNINLWIFVDVLCGTFFNTTRFTARLPTLLTGTHVRSGVWWMTRRGKGTRRSVAAASPATWRKATSSTRPSKKRSQTSRTTVSVCPSALLLLTWHKSLRLVSSHFNHPRECHLAGAYRCEQCQSLDVVSFCSCGRHNGRAKSGLFCSEHREDCPNFEDNQVLDVRTMLKKKSRPAKLKAASHSPGSRQTAQVHDDADDEEQHEHLVADAEESRARAAEPAKSPAKRKPATSRATSGRLPKLRKNEKAIMITTDGTDV